MKKEEKELKKAYFWRRFFAYLIDVIIVNIIVYLPFKSSIERVYTNIGLPKGNFIEIYGFLTQNQEKLKELTPLLIMISLITVVSLFIYFTVLEYKFGQTIGKILTRIEVRTKGKLKLKQCLIRNVTKALGLTNLWFLFLVDVIYILFSKQQRFTERLSNTWVELK